MAEMRTLNCPQCVRENQPLSAVDGIEEYRCRSCGLVYYGPCGCDTSGAATSGEPAPRHELTADWRMSRTALRVENGAQATSRPGGC
jgi:rubredoxin